MLFDNNRIYYVRLSDATFGALPKASIDYILKDGRHSSPFIEASAPLWFNNIEYIPGNKSCDFKFIDKLNKPLEMRGFSSLSKNKKCNLIPSNMIGASRKYDEMKYIEKLNSISGFLITYQLFSYNEILIFHYSSIDALANDSIKKALYEKDIEAILGDSVINLYNNLIKPLINVEDNIICDLGLKPSANLIA